MMITSVTWKLTTHLTSERTGQQHKGNDLWALGAVLRSWLKQSNPHHPAD